MATAEEHYRIALNMANNIGEQMNAATQQGGAIPIQDVMSLAALHVDLGRMRLEIDRPGRSLILPN